MWELPTGKHRLDHVVHQPFRSAGANDRVQLVDERDDLALSSVISLTAFALL